MNLKWNCRGSGEKISTADKVLDIRRETDEKGDEGKGGEEGIEIETGLDQFYKRFPFATSTR
jgi:hypothetical protein